MNFLEYELEKEGFPFKPTMQILMVLIFLCLTINIALSSSVIKSICKESKSDQIAFACDLFNEESEVHQSQSWDYLHFSQYFLSKATVEASEQSDYASNLPKFLQDLKDHLNIKTLYLILPTKKGKDKFS